jgi:hypothetical protein
VLKLSNSWCHAMILSQFNHLIALVMFMHYQRYVNVSF